LKKRRLRLKTKTKAYILLVPFKEAMAYLLTGKFPC